jgi:glycine betaine/choline ABC-type transport system substrate-binding protein
MTRIAVTLLLVSVLLSCNPAHRGIVIGSKNFTEQVVLGELLAQQIERHTGERVDRRFYLGGTFIAHQALLAGRIDGYVEYTGTALTAVLKEQPSSNAAEVYDRVKRGYAQRFNLLVLPALGFDNGFAVVIRSDDARRLQLRTISDLAARSSKMRIGVGYEFLERPDGYPGLAEKYGLRFAEAPRVMDLGLLYRALKEKEVDVAVGSNTDAQIEGMKLVVLEDDRNYFPPYDAVPIVRSKTVESDARVRSALDGLTGRVTVQDIRRMNYQVEVEHADVRDVVSKFLDRLNDQASLRTK